VLDRLGLGLLEIDEEHQSVHALMPLDESNPHRIGELHPLMHEREAPLAQYVRNCLR
jgi:hypothetical protein